MIRVLLACIVLTGCATVQIPHQEAQIPNKRLSTSDVIKKLEKCLIKKGFVIARQSEGLIDTQYLKVSKEGRHSIYQRLSLFSEPNTVKYVNRYACAIDPAVEASINKAISGVAVASYDKEKPCEYLKSSPNGIPEKFDQMKRETNQFLQQCID
ncbi:MAG: hypothetical protein H6623_08995 [Bdellovibrionaceae bacterium]|nr:hypothetical protein [Pseudobdellovibrionaceae bacterium]